MTKRCPRCETTKPIDGFYLNAARPDGHGGYCKPCEIESQRPHRVSVAGRRRSVAQHRRRRQQLIDDLGGRCACCGETQYEFLQFDHVNGNGAAHRRELGRHHSESDIRRRLSEFQVLCANCNLAKGVNGICPHQTADLQNRVA